MGEETYMNKEYCLECMGKHSQRLEHHAEDLFTSSRDNPELREIATDFLDKARDLRKTIDNLRIEELSKKKLSNTI